MVVIKVIVGKIMIKRIKIFDRILKLVLLKILWIKGIMICKLINLYIIEGILISNLMVGCKILVFFGEIFVIKIAVLMVKGVVISVDRIVIIKEFKIIGRVLNCLFEGF